MKRYKLLKDLPTFRAGDIFVLANDGCLYLIDNEDGKYCDMSTGGHWKKNVMAYHKNTLQHFPNILEDWFEEIEEHKCSALALMILTLTNFIENEPDEDTVDLEDCKQMLDKLKAWKRLGDKGFRFTGYTDDSGDLFSCQVVRCSFDDFGKESREDLDLLFGGEE